MTSQLFLMLDSSRVLPMSTALFDSELDFQDLLGKFPQLLTDLGDHPRRWMLVKSESTVAGKWSIDLLYLDDEGVPTLVEVKRSTDTRVRREVVGQLLEYAANAVTGWTAQSLQAMLDKQCQKDSIDSNAQLETIGVKDDQSEIFWQRVEANLRSGRVRLLFVVDVVPPELEQIVLFLNEQMRPATVLALELRLYKRPDSDEQILLPRLIGASQKAIAIKTVSQASNAEEWLGDSSDRDELRPLVESLQKEGAIWSPAGSTSLVASIGGIKFCYLYPPAKIILSLYQLKKSAVFAEQSTRSDLLEELSSYQLQASSDVLDGEPALRTTSPTINRVQSAAEFMRSVAKRLAAR